MSGRAAVNVVTDTAARPTGRLAALSLQAVRYGQALGISDVGTLSRRLYAFGSIPRGPHWDRLIGGEHDLAGLLGLGPQGHNRHVLASDYQVVTHEHWLAWSRIDEVGDPQPRLPYKLYVSPRPEALADAFRMAVGVLAAHEVWSFKMGRGILGVLRSDKFVVYVEDLDRLGRLARALAGALDGCPAQGVPFSAQASDDGLLSWGMDPPAAPHAQPRESWRSWVTDRVAAGLVEGATDPGSAEPWEVALERLEQAGVDTATWRPCRGLWGERT